MPTRGGWDSSSTPSPWITCALLRAPRSSGGTWTPRTALVREVLLAAAAIERGDPAAARIVGSVLVRARHAGFLSTVVTAAPQLTSYLVEHSTDVRPEPFMEQLIAAALEVRTTRPDIEQSRGVLAAPLTGAELMGLEAPADQHVPADRHHVHGAVATEQKITVLAPGAQRAVCRAWAARITTAMPSAPAGTRVTRAGSR